MRVPGMGYNDSSRTAKMFYGALLDQQVYWEATMAAEAVDGIVQFDLPVRRNNICRLGCIHLPLTGNALLLQARMDTDGRELGHKATHCLVRDMIIRANTWMPKYSVVGKTTYSGPIGWNVDLTIESSVDISLALCAVTASTQCI